jgi:hypothetical protein
MQAHRSTSAFAFRPLATLPGAATMTTNRFEFRPLTLNTFRTTSATTAHFSFAPFSTSRVSTGFAPHGFSVSHLLDGGLLSVLGFLNGLGV